MIDFILIQIISQTFQANAHQVCCEASPTKGQYSNLCQSDDLDLHKVTSASQT